MKDSIDNLTGGPGSSIDSGLDSGQLAAAEAPERRILVAAGPGSGKTRTLTARFARLVRMGRRPAAITFTTKAAGVLRERLSPLGPAIGGLKICTFHALALDILKEERPDFKLFGKAEGILLLKELGVKAVEISIQRISRHKSIPGDVLTEDEERVFNAYEAGLKERSALDLDDLILETVKILSGQRGPEITDRLFTDLLIDEFQDINPPQARLVKLLSRGASLLCIGDPDQSVYGFRGANLGGFLSFKTDYPDARIITLGTNYRSGERIVEASAALIKNNTGRLENTLTARRTGGDVTVVEAPIERAEERFITEEIERLMGGLSSLTVGGGAAEGTGGLELRFSDFAVLVRTNRQVEILERVFKDTNIPSKTLKTPTGAELSAFTKIFTERLTLEPGEEAGDGPLNTISEFSHLIRRSTVEAGLGEALSGKLTKVALEIEAAGGEAEEFLDEIKLLNPEDLFDIETDRVSIATLHMSKGLEFEVVFIPGAEAGLVPFERGGVVEDMEEERRLFYVGMTRAATKLYITNTKKRRLYGETEKRSPSPFIEEIPLELIAKKVIKEKAVKRRPLQKGLFD